MANKTLTARVRLETSQAERSIQRLSTKINRLNATANRIGGNGSRVNSQLTQSNSKMGAIVSKARSWNTQLTSTNRLFGSIGGRLKSIAATYLGIMGGKAIVGLSDKITSAKNKLNYVSAQQLGAGGVTADGGAYSSKTLQVTQQAMDKMYVSANKVRMSYTDMMSNVSKSMALAGKAFGGSTDNAIRFQEVMAEAYAIGGASAQEMSSSMYQMIQALGAGVLAGDELRSVREGAPLAYQAIEKFAQGVYDCEDSLKDMASQGKITSELVVAAIMDASKTMDEAFKKTNWTFAQVWEVVKNMATYSFKPVSKQLSKMLNDFAKSDGFKKLEKAFLNISKVLQIILKVAQNVFGWIADNWDKVSKAIIWGLSTIVAYLVTINVLKFVDLILSLSRVDWAILTIVASLGWLIYTFILWKTGAIDSCEAVIRAIIGVGIAVIGVALLIKSMTVGLIGGILLCIGWAMLNIYKNTDNMVDFIYQAALWLGEAIMILAFMVTIATGNWIVGLVILIIGAIIYLLGWCVKYAEQVCYWAGYVGAIIVQILMGVWDFIVYLVFAVISLVVWLGATVINLGVAFVNGLIQIFMAICDPVFSIVEWIYNAFTGGFDGIAGACANLIGQVCSWFLSLGKIVTTIIDAIFGTDWTGGLNSLQEKVLSWGKKDDALTLDRKGAELPRIETTKVAGAVFDWGSQATFLENDMYSKVNADEWATASSNWGANLKDSINGWGDKLEASQNERSGGKWLDEIAKKLGLDFSDMGFPDPNDLANQLTPYDAPSEDYLKQIADNTDDTNDKLELKDEDLEYLRKIAEMEWRNEFTTAEIKVDMTNHNTVNGDRDLDGIVSYLSDVLREEMSSVAYGVHY